MTPETDFFVHPDWNDALERAGLLDFGPWERGRGDPVLSRHKRGWVHSVRLADGRHVFAKFDALTQTRRIVSDLLRLRRPQPLTYRERTALNHLTAAGLRGPEVLAWAQRRRNFLIPNQAVLILGKLEGVSVMVFMRSSSDTASRQRTLQAVGREVGRLYRAGLQWPDLGVDHVFVTPDLRVGFLDVDRLRPRSLGLTRLAARQMAVFVDELTRLNATRHELAALRDGLAQVAPPALAARAAQLVGV
jgi:tRNA A-37 threonylcarbamoyl transferase component Bud32